MLTFFSLFLITKSICFLKPIGKTKKKKINKEIKFRTKIKKNRK